MVASRPGRSLPPVSIRYKAECAPEPVWTQTLGEKSFFISGIPGNAWVNVLRKFYSGASAPVSMNFRMNLGPFISASRKAVCHIHNPFDGCW
jgi:hypothetical protein